MLFEDIDKKRVFIMNRKKVMQKWDEYKDKYTLVKCMDGSYYRIWKDKNDLKGIQPLSEYCKIDDDAEIIMLSDFLKMKHELPLEERVLRRINEREYEKNLIVHKTKNGNGDYLKRLFEMDVD